MQDKEKIRLQELAHKYLNRTLTSDEQQEFDHWFEQTVDEPITILSNKKISEKAHKAEIFSGIQKELQFKEGETKPIWPRIGLAASLFLCLTAAIYFYSHRSVHTVHTVKNIAKPIEPGGNKAYLTLANGKRIILTDADNGTLAKESGVQISKTADGQLIYTLADNQQASSETYNSIETPRGGQYQVRLPDGTQVWLNSASVLKYPVCFNSKAVREVKLQGEAYFEVAKNKKMPFIVEIKDKQQVKVLGTHFNIKAYTDEPRLVETTLLEGSVEISNTFQKGLLKPGQQASLQENGHFDIIDHVDVNGVIAWKNGQILFTDQDIKSIMRQISRWYDIDVEYRGNIPERSFNGGISKNSSLQEILKILELNHIHFKTEGRKLIVSP